MVFFNHNITSIAYIHHTDIYPLLNIYLPAENPARANGGAS